MTRAVGQRGGVLDRPGNLPSQILKAKKQAHAWKVAENILALSTGYLTYTYGLNSHYTFASAMGLAGSSFAIISRIEKIIQLKHPNLADGDLPRVVDEVYAETFQGYFDIVGTLHNFLRGR